MEGHHEDGISRRHPSVAGRDWHSSRPAWPHSTGAVRHRCPYWRGVGRRGFMDRIDAEEKECGGKAHGRNDVKALVPSAQVANAPEAGSFTITSAAALNSAVRNESRSATVAQLLSYVSSAWRVMRRPCELLCTLGKISWLGPAFIICSPSAWPSAGSLRKGLVMRMAFCPRGRYL